MLKRIRPKTHPKLTLILVLTLLMYGCNDSSTTSQFSDQKLAACITGNDDLLSITELSCGGSLLDEEPLDPTGIEQLKNLHTLSLTYCDVDKVDFNAFPKLQTLKLTQCFGNELNIQHNTQLESLDFYQNDFPTIHLGAAQNLKVVALNQRYSERTELHANQLPSLERLTISNVITEFTNPILFQNLIVLEAYDSHLKNTELSHLTLLEELRLGHIADITHLDLENITSLKKISLRTMSNLTELKLPPVQQLEELHVNFTGLPCESVYAIENEYIDVPIFSSTDYVISACGPSDFIADKSLARCIEEKMQPMSQITELTCDSVESTEGLGTLKKLHSLDLQGSYISNLNLNGLQNLSTLKIPYVRTDDIDLSLFPNLEELEIKGQFTSVKLPEASTLHHLTIESPELLNIDTTGQPLLETLNLSLAPNANIQMEIQPQLTTLNLFGKMLDLTLFPALETLELTNIGESLIDLSPLTQLSHLSIVRSPMIAEIDVTENGLLRSFNSIDLGLTELDLSRNPQLQNIHLSSRTIEHLNLSNTNIRIIENISLPNLRSVDFTNAKIEELTLSSQYLEEIDLTDAQLLRSITLWQNQLTSLNLNNKPKLGDISLGASPELLYLNLENSSDVAHLLLSETKLADLNIQHLQHIEQIKIGSSNLTQLDLQSLSYLKYLSIGDSPIESLLLPISSKLENLTLGANLIEYIDLKPHLHLKRFVANIGGTESIDLSASSNLNHLELEGRITELTPPYTSNLTFANISDCGAPETSIDLSQQTQLKTLILNNCPFANVQLPTPSPISSLSLSNMDVMQDIPNLPDNLLSLSLSNTGITELDLNLFDQLELLFLIDNPIHCGEDGGVLFPSDRLITCF